MADYYKFKVPGLRRGSLISLGSTFYRNGDEPTPFQLEGLEKMGLTLQPSTLEEERAAMTDVARAEHDRLAQLADAHRDHDAKRERILQGLS